MILFVGAGSGDPDLITVKGRRLLRKADLVIYAGSLVNPQLLMHTKAEARILDSSTMTLEEVVEAMTVEHRRNGVVVRLHTGDPSLYGAIREQMDALAVEGIPFDVVPGVSSFTAAAAAIKGEYTLPGVSQTLILTRMAGRTPVPADEQISSLSMHGTSMAIFLSAGMLDKLQAELLKGAYQNETPAAIVYKASWPDEQVLRCTVGTLAETGSRNGISKTALVLVGDFLGDNYERSQLYHPSFTTGYRKGANAD